MREPTPPARRSLAGLPRLLRPAGRRTSRPPPGSTPTRSSASPRCSSTCCATSSRPTSRSPSTSPGRRSACEEYAEYKASRVDDPRRVPGPGLAAPGGARRAAASRYVEVDGLRGRRRHRHADHPGARAQGFEVLICSGDRDAFQLVTDDVTVLYPVKGVSELARMTPEAVEAKYGVPPERYPDLAALVGETSDNLPGVPGVGPKTAAKWINQYGDLDRRRRPRRRDQGQGGRVAARAPRRRAAQPPAQPAGPRPRAAASTVDDLERQQLGPRAGAHGLRRPGVPGAARPALRVPRGAAGGGRVRLRARRRASSPPSEVAGVAGRARRAPARASACTSSGTGARGTGDVDARSRSPPTAARRPTSTSPTLDPPTEEAVARLAGRPDRAQGAARRQGAAAGARGPGLAAARARPATPRWRPTSSGPTSAPTTWPTSSCATSSASCGPRPSRRGQGLLDFGDDGDAGAAGRHGAGPRRARPGRRRSTTQLEATGGTALLSATSSCRWSTCWPGWSGPASPPTSTAMTGARGATSPPTVREAQERRLRRDRRRADQPRLAQAAAGGAVRRARACRRPSAPRPATPPTPTR